MKKLLLIQAESAANFKKDNNNKMLKSLINNYMKQLQKLRKMKAN